MCQVEVEKTLAYNYSGRLKNGSYQSETQSSFCSLTQGLLPSEDFFTTVGKEFGRISSLQASFLGWLFGLEDQF